MAKTKPGDDDLIHITTPDDWAAAQAAGSVAATMATEGFVHCSTRGSCRARSAGTSAGPGRCWGCCSTPTPWATCAGK